MTHSSFSVRPPTVQGQRESQASAKHIHLQTASSQFPRPGAGCWQRRLNYRLICFIFPALQALHLWRNDRIPSLDRATELIEWSIGITHLLLQCKKYNKRNWNFSPMSLRKQGKLKRAIFHKLDSQNVFVFGLVRYIRIRSLCPRVLKKFNS